MDKFGEAVRLVKMLQGEPVEQLDCGIQCRDLMIIASFYPVDWHPGDSTAVAVRQVADTLGIEEMLIGPVFERYAVKGLLSNAGEGRYNLDTDVRRLLQTDALSISKGAVEYLKAHADWVYEGMIQVFFAGFFGG